MTASSGPARPGLYWALVALLVVVYGGLSGYRLGRVDIHVDEHDYVLTGDLYVTFALAGDFFNPDWRYNSEHPPVAKLIYGLAFQAQKMGFGWAGWYRSAKLASVALTAGTIILIVLLGRMTYGPWAGLLGGALFAFMPHIFAHGRIAGLESPTYFFHALTFVLLLKALRPGAGKLWWVLMGLGFGLTVGVRFNNGLLLLAIILTLVLVKIRPADDLVWPGFNWATIGWPVIGFLIFVAVWPWVWPDPINRLLESTLWQAKRRNWEWFFGDYGPLPWYYYLTYTFFTTPPLVIAGFVSWLHRLRFRFKTLDLIMIVWLIVPFAMSAMSFKQDGIRYVIQIMPFLALIAAVGLLWIGQQLGKIFTFRSTGLQTGIGLLATGAGLWAVLSFNPYQLNYYNIFAGSTQAIDQTKRFELRWWGEGLSASLRHLNAIAPQGAKVAFGLEHFLARNYPLRSDLQVVPAEKADYFIALHSIWMKMLPPPQGWEPIFEERFKGLTMSVIYRRP